jgi:hypothetical protein
MTVSLSACGLVIRVVLFMVILDELFETMEILLVDELELTIIDVFVGLD